MTFPEFISAVQARAGLNTLKEALTVTDATLSILGVRLFKTSGDMIGIGLAPQIREYLLAPFCGVEFGMEEFYRRVCVAAGIDLLTARARCGAVVSVLRDAMAPGEIEEIRGRLPVEYKPLFSWNEGLPMAA